MNLNPDRIFPREQDHSICYLKNIIANPNISVGDYTFYHDFADPREFERKNVLYQYPINHDRLMIGKYCSLASGAKFLFNSANHTLSSLSTYPFPLFAEWDETMRVTEAWDNKGDIVVGNDVWIGYEAVILAGVRIGDGAVIGARSVVTRDVSPYAIVAGAPARLIRKRFDESTITALLDIRWWDWPPHKVSEHLSAIRSGNVSELQAANPK